MGLFGLGKTKIKSSDPKEREQAIRDLPVAEQGTFIELALGDSDAGVRLVAAARVREASYLQHLAKHKDPAIAKIGRDRLAAIAIDQIKQARPSAAAALLEHIDEQNALAGIALQAEHADVRKMACERLLKQTDVSEAMLTRIAVQDEQGQLAERVLPQIHKRQHLKEVSRKAKVDSVRQRAQQQLEREGDDKKQPSREQRRLECAKRLAELVDRARTLSDEVASEDGDAGFAALLSEVEGLVSADPDLPEDDTLRESRLAIERARGAFLRQREEQASAAQPVPAQPAPASGDQVADDIAAEDSSVAEAPAEPEPAAEPLEPALQAKADELIAAIEALAGQDDLSDVEQPVFELDKRWRVELADVPNQHPTRQQFMAAWQRIKEGRKAAREARKLAQEREAERLEPLVIEAEQLAEREPADEELPAHRDALKALQARRRELGRVDGKRGRELHRRFTKACDKAYQPVKRLHEAAEWERFARASRAEELITAVKELSSVETLTELFDRVKTLQAEWKALGSLPRERNDELWGAFKAECDAVYERLQPMFAERDAERAENLVRKRELLAEVERVVDANSIGLAGSMAEQDSMKERFERIQELDAQWKEIGPVPHGEDRALWQAYKAARDRFFAKRREAFKEKDAERVENLNRKLAVCVEVDELVEDFERFLGGTPVGAKTELDFLRAVKELQKSYREIGHVPRDRFEEIRDRFKASCDKIYQGLEPWFAKQDEERQANLERKQAILTEMEELLKEDRPDWFKDEAAKLRSQWREAGPVPRDAKDIEERFYQACADIFDVD